MKNIIKNLTFLVLVFAVLAAKSQTRTVTGVIKDSQGPVPGVSVIEKGVPGNGVSTDVEGKFRITLRGQSNTITVGGIGYLSRDILVRNSTPLNINMETDSKGLEEVVVVGYGTQKKIAVTGSISTVSREEIQQTPSASIQNSLAGKLPGFFSQQRSGQPGGDAATFFVRGVSTYNTGTQPLILVDDIEFTYADFSNIDPNEVQSLSILKDAAATAVYGVRGGNGVVLVTTRRGQVGTPRINVRSEFGYQAPMQIPKLLSSADMATLKNEALKNDAFISGGVYKPDFTDQDIELFRNGTDPFGHPDIDWYNTLFKKAAPISKTNVDLSGGTNVVKYFTSFGYENQAGILRDFTPDQRVDNGFSFNRFNFRSNLDIQATKSLAFKLDLSGNNSTTNQPQMGVGAFGEIYNYEALTPFVYPLYNPDGSYGFSNPNRAPTQNNIIGRLANGGYDRNRQNLLSLNVSVIQKLDAITKGLQAKFLISIANSNNSSRSQTIGINNFPSFYYNPATNTYSPRNSNIFRTDPYTLEYSGGNPRRQSTLQAYLTYDRSFKKHNVTGLLLLSRNNQLRSFTGLQAVRSYLPNTLQGLTSRVAYNYANKYLIEFNGGYNGSNAFSEDNRYGFFPAGSVGWVISEENFIKNNFKALDLFKIRASYGVVGNDDLAGFQSTYEENYRRGGSYSFGQTNNLTQSIIPGSLANRDITWEKERKAEIGLDFALFNGKISGTTAYFDNRRRDILSRRQTVPSYFGITNADLPPVNLGIVSNKGYEFELNYNGKFSTNLGFNLRGNYSYAKNKILEIDEVPQKYDYKVQTGRSIGEQQGFIWDGYYSVEEAANPAVPKYIGSTTAGGGPGTTLPGFLKYRDLNGDGVITDDDRGFFGRPNLPNTTLGLGGGLTYRRFSFNFLLQGALNSEVQVGYNFSVPFKGNLQDIHLDRWTPETAETAKFPSLVSNFHGTYMTTGSNSSFWAINGKYLRIKSLELGYKVPEKAVNKLGLKGLRVYANAYNLFTWSPTYEKYGLDPEIARGGASNNYELPYPVAAIFNLGLNVSIK